MPRLFVTQLLGLAALLLSPASSAPTTGCDWRNASEVTTLQSVPGTQSLENIAVRENGNLLVTSTASPTLFYLSPEAKHAPIPVVTIAGVNSLLGITELGEKDIFYVLGSNLTSTENSNGLWKVDLRNFRTSHNGTVLEPAVLSLVTLIPSALQLNGMARLAKNDTQNLLMSDSARGIVLRLNVNTKAVETVISEPEMAPVSSSSSIGVAINGIRIRGNKLYFVSLDQGLFGRVPISLTTGTATDSVETLATNITFGDDFALSRDGKTAYVATNGPLEVLRVDLVHGGKTVVASSPLLGAASSVALDLYHPRKVLYVTGAVASGNSTVGRVSRVTLRC
ncbi:hypothetical protein CSAL01_00567 [Colletotrichum salicis]|uniref:SMP-30/Gluconolactonase/LRE-like region domain-containing protein n=1 Tax=Colletotrichum salicis TaxID=1209931 RepID=A0A135UPT0_9PEZI|nr:hypothetical protein CSAL01_00567 [Colletotrichum salicis]